MLRQKRVPPRSEEVGKNVPNQANQQTADLELFEYDLEVGPEDNLRQRFGIQLLR
jgi:hypothetical protein